MSDRKGMSKGKEEESLEDRKARLDAEMVIPGEVGVRRKHKVSKEATQKAKDEFVTLEWEDVFPKKPYERLRWLDKALRSVKDGRVKALPVFDIIIHRRFLEGLKGSIATDCLNLIRGSLDVFTPKQQKQLTSDNFELFRKYAPINVLDSDDDEKDLPPLPPPPKVIIEERGKRKKGRGGDEEERRKREREADEDGNDTDDDVETKRLKILSKGIERRVDPADGVAYTLLDFINEYGGSTDRPPEQWQRQKHTSFIFKA